MTEQPEAGDVGGPGSSCCEGHGSRPIVQSVHGSQSGVDGLDWGLATFDPSGDRSDTQGLTENQSISRAEPGVGEKPVRMRFADHREAELGFGIIDGVTTGDHEPALVGHILGAG